MKNVKAHIAILLITVFTVSAAGCISFGNAENQSGIEPQESTDLSNGLTVNMGDTGVSDNTRLGHEPPEGIGVIANTAPHIPIINIPRARIEVQGTSSPKVYIPLEYEAGNNSENMPQPQEIKGELPVIAYYGFDDNWHGFEIIFDRQPEYAAYTLYDGEFKEVYTNGAFSLPSQTGDYVLRIDASWITDGGDSSGFAYFISLVVGEPREPCVHADWYHGGGNGLVLYEGFHELLDLYALLEQNDGVIEEHLNAIYNYGDDRWVCPCFMKTKADVQNLFSWLRPNEVRLPFSDSVPLREILIRDRYADIYARYTIGDMLFNFNFSLGFHNNKTAEELFELWKENPLIDYRMELITTVGDVNIYITDGLNDDPRVIFVLSVDGAYIEVEVSIPCADPSTCDRGNDISDDGGHYCFGEQVDRQSAINGIMQFEFRSLFAEIRNDVSTFSYYEHLVMSI